MSPSNGNAKAKVKACGWWSRRFQRPLIRWTKPKKLDEMSPAETANLKAAEDRLVNDVVGLLTLKTEEDETGQARIVKHAGNKGTKKEWRENVKLGLDKMEWAGMSVWDGSRKSRKFVRLVVDRLEQDPAFQTDGRFDLEKALKQISYVEQASTGLFKSKGFGPSGGKSRKVKLVSLIRAALVSDVVVADIDGMATSKRRRQDELNCKHLKTLWADLKVPCNKRDSDRFTIDRLALRYNKIGSEEVQHEVQSILDAFVSASTKSHLDTQLWNIQQKSYLKCRMKALGRAKPGAVGQAVEHAVLQSSPRDLPRLVEAIEQLRPFTGPNYSCVKSLFRVADTCSDRNDDAGRILEKAGRSFEKAGLSMIETLPQEDRKQVFEDLVREHLLSGGVANTRRLSYVHKHCDQGTIDAVLTSMLKDILKEKSGSGQFRRFLGLCDFFKWDKKLAVQLPKILSKWNQQDVSNFLSKQRTEADRIRLEQRELSIGACSPSHLQVIKATRTVNLRNVFDSQKSQTDSSQFPCSTKDIGNKHSQPGTGNFNRPYFVRHKSTKKEYVVKKDETTSSQRSLCIDQQVSTETENILFCSRFGKILAEKMRDVGYKDAQNIAGETRLGQFNELTGTEFATVTARFNGHTLSERNRSVELTKKEREFIGLMQKFDYITGQTDRNSGNAILSSEGCYLIDNGGASMGPVQLPESGFDCQAPGHTITFTRSERDLVEKLSEDDIDQAAKGLGLSDQSIKLAKERLRNLKTMAKDPKKLVESTQDRQANLLLQCGRMAKTLKEWPEVEEFGRSLKLVKSDIENGRVSQERQRKFAKLALRLDSSARMYGGRIQLSREVREDLLVWRQRKKRNAHR